MSAIVLGILPLGVGLAFYVMNPTYIQVLFDNTGGQIALGAASVVMVGGFFWMKKVIDIDV
jgi:tight adherence protein B